MRTRGRVPGAPVPVTGSPRPALSAAADGMLMARVVRWLGPIAFAAFLVFPPPGAFSPEAWLVLGLTLLPLVAALALQAQVAPLLLAVPVALAAAAAFMLPVATPPNAIVFGSDRLTVLDMVRGGALPTLAAVLLLTLVAMVWVGVVLGSG